MLICLSCFQACHPWHTYILMSLNCGFKPLSDWNQTTYGSPSPLENGQSGIILPIVLQHLVPFWISLIGLGAIASAVMSSVDSVLLSAASLLGRNIFKNIIFTQVLRTSGESVVIASSFVDWCVCCIVKLIILTSRHLKRGLS